MHHLRHAFRRLTKTPGFTAVAVLTLALGIGASTAIFSIVNGVLLQPLAYREPGQLVWLRESTPSFGSAPLPINADHFLTWRERAGSFSALSILDSTSATLTGLERPEQLGLAGVSSGFFDLLGVAPALGRSFAPEEEIAGKHRVVVISDALWRRAYAADPSILGRSILVDHEPHVVIGVLPASYRHPHMTAGAIGSAGPAHPDLFRPKIFSADELREKFGRHNYGAIGRLKPGVTVDQATAELNQIGSAIVAELGIPDRILRAVVAPLQEAIVGHSRRGLGEPLRIPN
jgi:putative ABC transport system permease protein